ncbi:MAG: prepilin-type N-terminal cleavage/methylation domain-containing protein [Opitutaceae bacterium]|nr:prepilin-type N-terminal cleavage/methylation domain-containing protein [Opitutaceae bacterium]
MKTIGTTRVRHPAAFTLVEVLVSLALFALAAVALSAAYLNVIAAYRDKDEAQDRRIAVELVRIAALTEPDRDALERGGTVDLPDRQTATWSARIEPTTVADLFRVELRWRTSGRSEEESHLQVMLHRPAWSEPGERDRLREASRQRLAEWTEP